ncbi:formate dehydrogenase subunit gamma, partial [Campylobacter coli]|nr:formate dehydrogenase subunit gamma [Campylobacter coli]
MEDCLHRKGTLMRKVFVTLLLSVASLFAYGSERMGQDT